MTKFEMFYRKWFGTYSLNYFTFLLFMVVSLPCISVGQFASVTKIWDKAPHNGFTDIIYFNNRFLICLREGQDHASFDGKLRVISSIDGNHWESVDLFVDTSGDLREAKFAVSPDDQLMLSGPVATDIRTKHQTKKWFSKDGILWSSPVNIGDKNNWLWRETVYNTIAYSIGYPTGYPNNDLRPPVKMYVSSDMVNYVVKIDSLVKGNETTLRFFSNDSAIALIRRDPQNALIGRSKSPFTEWKWYDCGYRLGGPNFIILPNGRIFGGARFYDGGREHTALFTIDKNTNQVKKYVELPSSGDNGYPGIVIVNDTVWISYYSSHEGKASIYLVKIGLDIVTDTAVPNFGPKTFNLFQNYPNPFNPKTRITYSLPNNSTVRMTIYNPLGQIVDEIEKGQQYAGVNGFEWSTTSASGMYFYRLEAVSTNDPNARFVQTKKMILIK